MSVPPPAGLAEELPESGPDAVVLPVAVAPVLVSLLATGDEPELLIGVVPVVVPVADVPFEDGEVETAVLPWLVPVLAVLVVPLELPSPPPQAVKTMQTVVIVIFRKKFRDMARAYIQSYLPDR